MTFDHPAYRKAYYTKPENRAKRAAYHAKYHVEHREEIAAYKAKYYAEHPEKYAAYRLAHPSQAHHLKRNYGITLDTYNQMLDAQGGRCAICGNTKDSRNLAVDHNHDTGKVRKLLCQACNKGLGHFGDSPEILREAVAYLEGQSS
jgi:5-methylcytosine-specific restriction endonuclease McrA